MKGKSAQKLELYEVHDAFSSNGGQN